MPFGAVRMILSACGGMAPQKGRVSIEPVKILNLSPFSKSALCDSGILTSSRVVAAFFAWYIVVVSFIFL